MIAKEIVPPIKYLAFVCASTNDLCLKKLNLNHAVDFFIEFCFSFFAKFLTRLFYPDFQFGEDVVSRFQ